MLSEFAEITMLLARAVGRRIAETGHAGQAEKDMLDEVGKSLRRTLALRKRFYDDSLRTAEQRHAENLRRIEVQARAQFRVRKAAVQRVIEDEIRLHVERTGMPGDAERLLSDMHERLFDADIARASTKRDFDAICLSICKSLGITPRDDTWSDALMASETHLTLMEMREAIAEREAREVDPPESEWHPDVLNRPPADVLKDRDAPPDTG